MSACTCHDPRVFGHPYPCGPLMPWYVTSTGEHWATSLRPGNECVKILTRSQAERLARQDTR